MELHLYKEPLRWHQYLKQLLNNWLLKAQLYWFMLPTGFCNSHWSFCSLHTSNQGAGTGIKQASTEQRLVERWKKKSANEMKITHPPFDQCILYKQYIPIANANLQDTLSSTETNWIVVLTWKESISIWNVVCTEMEAACLLQSICHCTLATFWHFGVQSDTWSNKSSIEDSKFKNAYCWMNKSRFLTTHFTAYMTAKCCSIISVSTVAYDQEPRLDCESSCMQWHLLSSSPKHWSLHVLQLDVTQLDVSHEAFESFCRRNYVHLTLGATLELNHQRETQTHSFCLRSLSF